MLVILKQALYFDRYTGILSPTLDVMRDERLRKPLLLGPGNATLFKPLETVWIPKLILIALTRHNLDPYIDRGNTTQFGSPS